MLQKTVQKFCGVFNTLKNFPILPFQVYVESHDSSIFNVVMFVVKGVAIRNLRPPIQRSKRYCCNQALTPTTPPASPVGVDECNGDLSTVVVDGMGK